MHVLGEVAKGTDRRLDTNIEEPRPRPVGILVCNAHRIRELRLQDGIVYDLCMAAGPYEK
jgi:hypothetical protein